MRLLRWALVSHHTDPAREPFVFDTCFTKWGANMAARTLNGWPPRNCWMTVERMPVPWDNT